MPLRIFDQKTVELVPDLIIMESETELTQYFIKEWSLEYKDGGILCSIMINLITFLTFYIG